MRRVERPATRDGNEPSLLVTQHGRALEIVRIDRRLLLLAHLLDLRG